MSVWNKIKKKPAEIKEVALDKGKKIVGVEQIKDAGKFINDITDSLNPKMSRKETFIAAMKRLNVSYEDLPLVYKYQYNRFYLFLIFSILGASCMTYLLVNGKFYGLSFIGFLLICFAQMFNASFRMMQIKNEELLPVEFWVKNTQYWWPSKYKAVKIIRKNNSQNSIKDTSKNKNNNVTDIKKRSKDNKKL